MVLVVVSGFLTIAHDLVPSSLDAKVCAGNALNPFSVLRFFYNISKMTKQGLKGDKSVFM